ncbi:hypothetical protein Tco_0991368 [Tanacetum coccineum]|uniref:Uncharacterized protein n=1 Tax=Tanacetum coccineum TaxID=301880 RepID=A0ABQ5F053_9ASTR
MSYGHTTQMIKSSNGDTPFSLTYGTKAVIPGEIGMPTLRTAEIDMVQNDEALEINLDLLEEEKKRKGKQKKKKSSNPKLAKALTGDLTFLASALYSSDSRTNGYVYFKLINNLWRRRNFSRWYWRDGAGLNKGG